MAQTPTEFIKQEMGTGDFLHRFFSPCKVPWGMLESEKEALIKIYGRKDRLDRQLVKKRKREIYDSLLKAFEGDYLLFENHRDTFGTYFGAAAADMTPEEVAEMEASYHVVMYFPITLPKELRQYPMTRESFSQGIAILTAQMDQLEKCM